MHFWKKKTPAARIGQLWHLLSIHLNVTMVWFLTLEFRRNRPCKTLPATHCSGKLTVACTQCHTKMLPNLQRPVVSLTGHNFVAKISITFRVWAYNAQNGHDVSLARKVIPDDGSLYKGIPYPPPYSTINFVDFGPSHGQSSDLTYQKIWGKTPPFFLMKGRLMQGQIVRLWENETEHLFPRRFGVRYLLRIWFHNYEAS